MAENEPLPKVGVGVLIVRDGKVLLGQRAGAHGTGLYGGTGGHLEFGESLEECARRETREEAGIEITNIKFNCLTNLIIEGKHYVDVGFVADWASGEPEVREPDKCLGWGWYDLRQIPEPLFHFYKNYLQAYKDGTRLFDS